MAVEYELKYRATPEILEKIQADFPGDYTVTEMTTTYYDTPGGDLAKLYWTLRHRQEGDKHICTLKTPGIDGRSEYEWCCEDIKEAIPHLSRLSKSTALSQLAERGLIAKCGARFTRTARKLIAGSTMAGFETDPQALADELLFEGKDNVVRFEMAARAEAEEDDEDGI
jgi:inorganic triphosphatase YgiF